MRQRTSMVGFALALMVSGVAHAQLASPNHLGVAMGHVHLTVANVAAAEKFFVTIGGKPIPKIRGDRALNFPGTMVLLHEGTPSDTPPAQWGGSVGSVIGHVSFTVPNSKETLAKWNAAGLKTMTNSSDGRTLSDEFVQAQLSRDPPGNPGQFFVLTPDGLSRIEILQAEEEQQVPIKFHHAHFYVADRALRVMQEWYSQHFGAVPGMRGRNIAADIPGANLSFSSSDDVVIWMAGKGLRRLSPTTRSEGQMLDHVGFEVKNLEAFCDKLQVSGVLFDTLYTKGSDGIGTAILTDLWGARIELTEGLRELLDRGGQSKSQLATSIPK